MPLPAWTRMFIEHDRNQNICKCSARVEKNDRGNSKTYHLT